MLLIHGSGGSFYRVATKAMAEDLRNQGYACLAINTKGHDTVWSPQGSGEYYGNALEILDNSRHDLRAGIDYLWEKGYRSIGLLGHSMGAVKVGYYAAAKDDDRVVTVILISPVRLSYSYYMESENADEFRSIIKRADRMEAEDRALELMEVRFPIPQMFSAASYLDKHGPAERYNLVSLAPRITVPMLVMGGELETHTRLRDCPQDMITAAVNSPRAEYDIVPGGNHSLLNSMDQASARVLEWLASLAPVSAGV
jgi:alpha-beta hydrolase superfamily lysophospholipase